MTKLLEQAVETIRCLPPAMQDHLAGLLLQFAGQEQPVVQMPADDAASFDESLAQEARGEFASDAHMRAIWTKHGL